MKKGKKQILRKETVGFCASRGNRAQIEKEVKEKGGGAENRGKGAKKLPFVKGSSRRKGARTVRTR